MDAAAAGLVVIPLRRNSEGYPKVPLAAGWQKARREDVPSFDWSTCEGMGLLLGEPSGNRAAIDIDDERLAALAFAYLIRTHRYPLMSYTARRRIHVHVIEPTVSASRSLRLVFEGRPVLVELKASGSQVVLPPTDGYTWANESWEPLYGNVSDIWAELAAALGVEADLSAHATGAGYPHPFRQFVERGERNNAIFVEGCRLAESGVALERALVFMTRRVATNYEPGSLTQREVERTLRSAYQHVTRARQ